MQGVLWAAVAGISFGLFQSFNRRASSSVDAYLATFTLLFVSVVFLGTATVLTEELSVFSDAPMRSLGWFALAGAVHFFFGWTFLQMSQRRVGAGRTGILLGTTPLFGTFLAFTILGERVRAVALVGVVLVVAGIIVLSLARTTAIVPEGTRSRLALSFGLLAALCWGLSPIFIRWGLEGLHSPMAGVTVGMTTSTAAYGVALLIRGRSAGGGLRDVHFGWLVVAGAFVALGIAGQWIALDLAPVAPVLALNQLAVPVVLLSAPLIIGGQAERITGKVATGAALVVTGTLLIIVSRA